MTVFHFLTAAPDQQQYLRAMSAATGGTQSPSSAASLPTARCSARACPWPARPRFHAPAEPINIP